MRRVGAWTVGLSVLAVLATVAYILVRDALNWPHRGWFRWIPLALGLLPVGVILPIGHWYLRALRRDWQVSGGRLCTHCGYDVSALAAQGTCPECGEHYDVATDAAVWKRSGFTRVDEVDSTKADAG